MLTDDDLGRDPGDEPRQYGGDVVMVQACNKHIGPSSSKEGSQRSNRAQHIGPAKLHNRQVRGKTGNQRATPGRDNESHVKAACA